MMESSRDYSLNETTYLLLSSLKHYRDYIEWAGPILDIFETIRSSYHTLNSITNSPVQLHELGEKIIDLESYLVVDLQKHVCMQNVSTPCHINRLHSLVRQAGVLLSADTHPDGEKYEFSCSKQASHLAAELQATFVEYGFCAALETLYDIGEAHRRLDALDLKVQSIEQSSDEEYKRNFSNNNNNRNIQQNGLVLAELQDTVAQLHGIQQCITEENMEKIQDRYSYLADRLTMVEQSLSRETIDISSASIESYVQLQSMLKQKPLDRLTECDILNILDEQMIHPGTRGWLFDRLQQWLYMTDKRVFYVTGRTGYGKTALSATICKSYSTDVAGSHFFQSALGVRNTTNSVFNMVLSLSSGLCRACPMYMAYITQQYKHDPTIIDRVLRSNHWEDLYQVLFKKPLDDLYSDDGACRTNRRRYMFVLDALNECRSNDWPHVKAFIAMFVRDLPSTFKLFVTLHSLNYSHLVPNLQDDIDGVMLENRAWINRHVKDVEIYLASSLGAILSGEDEVDTPSHAKADEMTLQETIDRLLKMTCGRFDFAIELMQSFSTQMSKGGQFLGSVKKALMPVRTLHGAREFDEEMSEFASPFRAYRDKEGRSVCVRVMRQSTYPMDKSRVALIRARHNIRYIPQ